MSQPLLASLFLQTSIETSTTSLHTTTNLCRLWRYIAGQSGPVLGPLAIPYDKQRLLDEAVLKGIYPVSSYQKPLWELYGSVVALLNTGS